MSCGGFSPVEVTQEITNLVNSNLAALNSATGANATSFTVVKAFSQVVAGTNYFLHLNTNDGKPFSAVIFVPLPHTNAPDQVTLGEAGHTDARNPN